MSFNSNGLRKVGKQCQQRKWRMIDAKQQTNKKYVFIENLLK